MMGKGSHPAGPEPRTHDQKVMVAREISDRLLRHYGDSVKAIALYGSVARGTDGPYSDVELYCILDGEKIDKTYEWGHGPWKAQVNVYSEDIILRDAGVVDETWPLVQRGYVDTEPLFDPNDLFSRVREIACETSRTDFKPWIRDLIVGEIYELVGKVRNEFDSGSVSVTVLGVDIVKYCAFLIGLANRHMYTSGSQMLKESMQCPDRPVGYDALCSRVISGELGDVKQVGDEVDCLWSGIEKWAQDNDIRIYEDLAALLE